MYVFIFLAYSISGAAFWTYSKMYRKSLLVNLSLCLFIYYLLNQGIVANLYLSACFTLPLLLETLIIYAIQEQVDEILAPKYQVPFLLQNGQFQIHNLRRGVSITGAAGSGKTESVIYNFLRHLHKYQFCGIIHDYKNFELTELAYPLYRKSNIPFYIIAFDPIFHRVNPIAPHYLPDEESVNEVARVLMENLLEQKDQFASGSSRFFNDAVEGILSGLIWKLRTYHPSCCTLPHLIATYQLMTSEQLISFLSSDFTSRGMADAFISGIDSERQTAAVKGTLANAFKKISTRKIFYTLSGHDIPLDINNRENPSVVSIINNPKLDSAYSPVIATIIHTIIKQMSIRNRESSFLLMEEAPTIRLLNMHRIPATLRSYDIATIYVMQDKIQNDLLYGEKASKAILSNLSYQFFGKANDPATAHYYEQFFELTHKEMISVSQSRSMNFDTRITRSQREVSKRRADLFFRLKPGQFVAYADGKEKLIQFKRQQLSKSLPSKFRHPGREDIEQNFKKIYQEAVALISSL